MMLELRQGAGKRPRGGVEQIFQILKTDYLWLTGQKVADCTNSVRSLEEEGLLKFDKRRVRFTDMEAVLREACILY